MASLAEDRRALAQFFLTQASMRLDLAGRPLNPLAFAALWLHANTDRSVTTAYNGDYGIIFSLLRIIAERGNPYDGIAPRLLCYDYDNILRLLVQDVNAIVGSTRYVGEGHFLIAPTAWPIQPDTVDPDCPPDPETLTWFANQHSVTHIVDVRDPIGKPWALDGYLGCYFVTPDLRPASYWDMLSAPVDDVRTAVVPVIWSGVDDDTDQGGAIGTGYKTTWPVPLSDMVGQGFYSCGSAERASGRAFYVNARRSHLARMCSPWSDGRKPMLQVDMLKTVFGGTVSMV
ncbi:hypothetical protein [Methylobacterium mesophilicum]